MTQSTKFEVLTEVARLVGGHPMVDQVQHDDTGRPKTDASGQTVTARYIGVAVPKNGSTDWKTTEWGQKIVLAAQAGWPNGEWQSPTFAWKITDGDSQIPNKKGRKPCEREGYPGHWVLQLQTQLGIKCYHANHYDPHEQIQDKNEIKAGDYCRVLIGAKANAPSQSPGVYLNPELFELTRAGQEIVLDSGPSAADAFGASPAQAAAPLAQPAPAQAAAPLAQPAPAPQPAVAAVQPAPDFLNAPAPAPEVKYIHPGDGNAYTEAQLLAAKWQIEQIHALPKA